MDSAEPFIRAPSSQSQVKCRNVVTLGLSIALGLVCFGLGVSFSGKVARTNSVDELASNGLIQMAKQAQGEMDDLKVAIQQLQKHVEDIKLTPGPPGPPAPPGPPGLRGPQGPQGPGAPWTLAGCGAFLDGGAWELVRHVPAGDYWHSATDQLVGTDAYGDPSNGALAADEWSVQFDNVEFDEFLFATGDCQKWLVAKKSDVLAWYSNEPRQIQSSSLQSHPYTARWSRRSPHAEDPWISLEDHAQAIGDPNILYGENHFGPVHAANLLPVHNGANVFIRKV